MDNYTVVNDLVQRFFSGRKEEDEDPLFPFLLNEKGTIDKSKLLLYLEKWVRDQSYPDEESCIKALEEAKKDDELFDSLLEDLSGKYDKTPSPMPTPPWGVLVDFWTYFGVAVRKCVGSKSVDIDLGGFLKDFPSISSDQRQDKATCVTAYNLDPTGFKKKDYPDLYGLFMPKISSSNRRKRTIKKHIAIAKAKAKRIMTRHSIDRYRLKQRTCFRGGANLIPDEFSHYAKKVNSI